MLVKRLGRYNRDGYPQRIRIEENMRVVVDRHACEGNARCSEVAPEIFEVRDDDKAFVRLHNPPESLKEKLKLAVRLCPRQAISIEE